MTPPTYAPAEDHAVCASKLEELRLDITETVSELRTVRGDNRHNASRHVALAITHLEDAYFRVRAAEKAYTRGNL